MNIGDYVIHIGFPPAEGEVVCVQKLNTTPETYKVCVRLDCGRLQWDMLENWSIKDTPIEIDIEDDNIIDGDFVILD